MTPDDSNTWVGRVIDQYEVLTVIGAGGMGVVYRARDSRLGRDVALKVLPEQFSKDRERVFRSEREARLLASLNHPNIAAIYDMKEAEGNRCLILEYVAGETLAELLKSGPVPMARALDISRQIAEALGAAHQAGIIHRDIKPANIKVTPEGRVKVLDFGLAKSLSTELAGLDPSDDPTLVTQTLPEVILGTPSYMSPEQLRGGTLDRRTDIWAFGCVLYELLTGRRTFFGGSLPEIIAGVLKSEPDWSGLPKDTPSPIREFLKSCLEKDLTQRLGTLDDAGIRLSHGTTAPELRVQSRMPVESVVHSLAILPFANTGGNAEMEYLSDGLTESIISSLSQLPELRVMARSSVFRYKGRTDEPRQIGRELGVKAVLTGRVLQRHENLLISAELVDVENGWQLWGEQYRRKSADIFAIEEDIAGEISEKLRLKLTPEKKSRLRKRYTENAAAYHLYLKGRFYWAKRTAEGLHRAIQYFREAIEDDPTYALAYAGLAEGYVPLGFYCHVAPTDAMPKARSAAQKALEIDPELAEARAVLAAIKCFFDWDLDAGEADARLAIEQDPKYPRSYQVLSECLVAKRRFSEAIREVERALELDPLSLHMNAAVTMTHYFAGQHEEAIEHGRRAVEMDASFFPGHFYLGLAYIDHRRYSDAVASLQQATALSGNSTMTLAALGSAFAFWGNEEEARRILRELEELRPRKYVPQTFVAAIYAGLGETGRAWSCLERAYEDRCVWLLRSIATDPRLNSLRHEPRFHDLARRVNVDRYK
jgi:eukaryotic-like serine/threonine-protein kinase